MRLKSLPCLLPLLTLCLVPLACRSNEADLLFPPTPIPSVSWGTSFGECVGYCITELSLTEVGGEFARKGWRPDVPPESQRFEMEPHRWAELWSKIDIEVLEGMDVTYGCPDCTDGGAEWIDIIDGGEFAKRIVFEFRQPPTEIAELVEAIRSFIPEP